MIPLPKRPTATALWVARMDGPIAVGRFVGFLLMVATGAWFIDEWADTSLTDAFSTVPLAVLGFVIGAAVNTGLMMFRRHHTYRVNSDWARNTSHAGRPAGESIWEFTGNLHNLDGRLRELGLELLVSLVDLYKVAVSSNSDNEDISKAVRLRYNAMQKLRDEQVRQQIAERASRVSGRHDLDMVESHLRATKELAP